MILLGVTQPATQEEMLAVENFETHDAIKRHIIGFENQVKELWETGDLPYLTHLCGGNEDQLISIFSQVKPEDWVFSTHRSHYHYLLKAWASYSLDKPGCLISDDLLYEIKQGRSMFIYSDEFNFVSSSIVAGCACIAAGVALGIQRAKLANHVWCFVGDGAEDEGHLYEAIRFAVGRNLPCTFVIEDNNKSVDTPKSERHGDYQVEWPKSHVIRYSYTPTYPHAGSGCKHHIKFKPVTASR